MCNKCGQAYTSPYVSERTIARRQKEQENQAIATMCFSMFPSLFNVLEQVIPTSKNEEEVEVNTRTRRTEEDESEEVVVAEDDSVQDKQTAETTVKNLLGEDKFNSLDDERKADILKKYSTITTYATNNGIAISDAEMTRRLNAYIKALEAHEQELKFGEHFIKNGDKADFSGNSIVYEEIATEKSKEKGNDEDYYKTILNRGIGTVQLYDTNGDNQVSREEFLAKEKADWKKLTGEDITSKMEDATTALFNRINKDNDTEYLSNAELGAFEYARATTGDVSTNSNQELTYEEWLLSSLGINAGGQITTDFVRAQNQIYNILEERDKPL